MPCQTAELYRISSLDWSLCQRDGVRIDVRVLWNQVSIYIVVPTANGLASEAGSSPAQVVPDDDGIHCVPYCSEGEAGLHAIAAQLTVVICKRKRSQLLKKQQSRA
jgi:hypothetical protein